jgi:hypothetical protein
VKELKSRCMYVYNAIRGPTGKPIETTKILNEAFKKSLNTRTSYKSREHDLPDCFGEFS